MSAEESQQDQSMEEILQSIKRIISEDEEEGAEPTDDKNALADDARVEGSDVLELTDMLDEPDAAAPEAETASIEDMINEATAAAPTPDADALDVLDLVDDVAVVEDFDEPIVESGPEPEPEVVEAPKVAESSEDTDDLVSDGVADDAAGAFAALAGSLEKEIKNEVAKEVPEFRSGNTVEDLVIESLRPMLREWLDDNLSQMVKRLVQREIERITSQRHF